MKLPLTRASRIVEAAHFMLQHEVSGAPNAVTHIDVLEVQGALARYQLQPVTGKRHQLRVHMAALGLPILNDGLYPALSPCSCWPNGSSLLIRSRGSGASSIASTDYTA